MSWTIQLQMHIGALRFDVALEGSNKPCALIGPNGSGKTTILRTMAGAHRPKSGHLQVQERVLFDSAEGVDLPPQKRRVGYLPQGYGLFPHLSVVDNVAFGHRVGSRGSRRTAAAALLDSMGCGELAPRKPDALSGGERQRVALARALMIEPQILLLDEPLSALDASARRELRAYLANYLVEKSTPSILVTHDLRDVVAVNADVYVIEQGRIVQHGAAETLAARPATAFVAEFFHSEASPTETR